MLPPKRVPRPDARFRVGFPIFSDVRFPRSLPAGRSGTLFHVVGFFRCWFGTQCAKKAQRRFCFRRAPPPRGRPRRGAGGRATPLLLFLFRHPLAILLSPPSLSRRCAITLWTIHFPRTAMVSSIGAKKYGILLAR